MSVFYSNTVDNICLWTSLIALVVYLGMILTTRKPPGLGFKDAISIGLRQSTYGQGLEVFQAFFSVVSCIQFVLETYYEDDEAPESLFFMELTMTIFFTAHYLLYLYLSENLLMFIFADVQALVDVFTIVPVFLVAVLGNSTLGSLSFLRFARVIKFVRVLRLLRIFRSLDTMSSTVIMDNAIMRQTLVLFTTVISFLVCCSGLVQWMANGNPDNWTNGNGDRMLFHDAFYFIVVVFSTVGFGDVTPLTVEGRMVVVVMIVVAVLVVPAETQKLLDLVNLQPKYGGIFNNNKRQSHIVLASDHNCSGVYEFLQEFYHSDHGRCDTHVVVLCPKLEPDDDVKAVLVQKGGKSRTSRLTYLSGDAIVQPDLLRARVQEAKACFVLVNKFSADTNNEDSHAVLRAMSIKRLNPRVRTFVQIIEPENRQHLLDIGIDTDDVLCVDELKHNVMGTNCICPAFSTFIANLAGSSALPDEVTFMSAWELEHSTGMVQEIYALPTRPEINGKNLLHVAAELYRHFSAAVIGVGVWDEDRHKHDVVLHPGPDYHCGSQDMIYVIAESSYIVQQYLKWDPADTFKGKRLRRPPLGRRASFLTRQESGSSYGASLMTEAWSPPTNATTETTTMHMNETIFSEIMNELVNLYDGLFGVKVPMLEVNADAEGLDRVSQLVQSVTSSTAAMLKLVSFSKEDGDVHLPTRSITSTGSRGDVAGNPPNAFMSAHFIKEPEDENRNNNAKPLLTKTRRPSNVDTIQELAPSEVGHDDDNHQTPTGVPSRSKRLSDSSDIEQSNETSGAVRKKTSLGAKNGLSLIAGIKSYRSLRRASGFSLKTFLDAHRLEEYLPVLQENRVTMKALALLTDEDFKEMGIPLGPRRELMAAVAAFQTIVGSAQEDKDFASQREEQMQKLEKVIVEHVNTSVKDHLVIVAETADDLYYLIAPIRSAGKISYQDANIPIVVMLKQTPTLQNYKEISFLPDLHFIVGNPSVYEDLLRARLHEARLCLVLTPMGATNMLEVDAKLILATLGIQTFARRYNRELVLYTELYYSAMAQHLRPIDQDPEHLRNTTSTQGQQQQGDGSAASVQTNASTTAPAASGADYMLEPAFASGRVVSSRWLETVMAQAYFSDNIKVIKKIVSMVDAVQVNEETGEMDILEPGTEHLNILQEAPRMMMLTLVQLNVEWKDSLTYSALYDHLVMEKCLLPLALYRPEKCLDNLMPYLLTNPHPTTKLVRDDKVMVYNFNKWQPESIGITANKISVHSTRDVSTTLDHSVK